ncbi:DNA polymerase III subunit beta [Piscirickettsia litoralis]|uniref:Beta sliding clamp n=1 Tax=Piscirickettsia litoralis TaxID=1891921 RepID=A0ABX3A2I3_9GAMM|nr:DNA polymerase III subunit beta [Piscirickettsia litoralis]ODN43048.1 DNA polymerase III subunit beta [Piscirickettsia litoralis]
MKFIVQRDRLLRPLQMLASVVERRHTLPVLSHILFNVQEDQLQLTASDLEIELISRVHLEFGSGQAAGQFTLPAKKVLDIVKNLPDEAMVEFTVDGERVSLSAGRSRFTLSSLSAHEFPLLDESSEGLGLSLGQENLKYLFDRVSFSMAQQDVRHYLNGMLLEVEGNILRAVATDGHRIALASVPMNVEVKEKKQVILPRKGVQELTRLLNLDADIELTLTENHLRVFSDEFTFSSKLIEGKFPDYRRVIPEGNDKLIVVDRDLLKQALVRVVILSNEKYRGVRAEFSQNTLKIGANNPEQEEAEDYLEVQYNDEPLEVGFNASYLQDILSVLSPGPIRLLAKDATGSVLIQESEDADSCYVVMPMRL